MKKYLAFLLFALCCAACGEPEDYQTAADDPLATRIYTLDNGLKVYMSVNRETPRIQTYITVKVGGKNDPAETTGLAHYFEHLMFKGTTHFGTPDYEAEKPKLDRIEELFEIYRNTTDEEARKELYYRIDGVSYEASKYAIPNEYDKLMSAIGARGTNAYTTKDMTVYQEDIPSNQIENWAKIQADRFQNPVIRGFHTELETIYEEKNMSLTNDSRKIREALDEMLFPNHPYGRQTVLGSQEHLKNPSITNVKRYHATYYVPNNMAVCLSGDFDPDEMIAVIRKYFGGMKPNANLPRLHYEPEQPIVSPIERTIYGPDAEGLTLAWRLGGTGTGDPLMAKIVSSLLCNGKAGLLDTNISQQQQALMTECMPILQPDYGKLTISGRPKAGQSLPELRDLLLSVVAKLRNGEFDENLLQGTINNYKVLRMKALEENSSRADLYVQSFANGTPWQQTVDELAEMERITKAQIVAWAQEKLGPGSYVVIYKRQGIDSTEKKIAKPRITPIVMNRDLTSGFVAEVQQAEVEPIDPEFVNYKKDMSVFELQPGIGVLYKQNRSNDLFTLTYLFETGVADNPLLGTAFDYLKYLGTPARTLQQINTALYDIACNFSFSATGSRCGITLTGLSEHMSQAMEIIEDLLCHAQPDEKTLENLKADQLQRRANAKLSQQGNFNALSKWVFYGGDFVRRTTLTNPELSAVTSEQLLGEIRSLMGKEHRILYYGPQSERELRANLTAGHYMADRPEPLPNAHLTQQLTPGNKVYVAPYTSKQLRYFQFSNRGETYDVRNDPAIMLYNEYFGGGMNSIVFQEMREARSLAYTAQASLLQPFCSDTNYGYMAYIATQNDKLQQAAEAFADIIEHMPESEAAFHVAKEALIARLRTTRTLREQVLWSYIDAHDLGLSTDRNKAIFKKIRSMKLDHIKAAQEKWVKGRSYYYGILGDTEDIDMKFLETLGPVQVLTQEELFGY